MSGLTSPSPIRPIAPVPGDGYVAGVCNIGPWEIRRRRRGAIAAFAATAGLFVLLVALGAPAWVRLFLLIPTWGGMVSWLQARRHFCAAFALGGLVNFGDGEATRRQVSDPAQRDADRRTMAVMLRDGLLLAIVPTAVLAILPL